MRSLATFESCRVKSRRLVKRSRALLGSNSTRDNQVRAGESSRRAWSHWAPGLCHAFFCPVIPPKSILLRRITVFNSQILRNDLLRFLFSHLLFGRGRLLWCNDRGQQRRHLADGPDESRHLTSQCDNDFVPGLAAIRQVLHSLFQSNLRLFRDGHHFGRDLLPTRFHRCAA